MSQSAPHPRHGPADPACIFCKIVAGAIPAHKVYEDDLCLAFLDVGPIVNGHLLVIPKAHHPNLVETPPATLAALAAKLPALAQAAMAATNTPACHVLTNNGAEASQSVQHLHFHILPRDDGDGYKLNWPAGKLDPQHASRLREALSRILQTQMPPQGPIT